MGLTDNYFLFSFLSESVPARELFDEIVLRTRLGKEIHLQLNGEIRPEAQLPRQGS